MKVNLVKYNKVYLELSWNWLNNKEIRKLTNTPQITKKIQKEWFDNLDKMPDYLIWGIEADNKPIGACGLKNITYIDCEYWGYIGEKKFWGRGIGSIILTKLVEIAKVKGLKSIWLKVIKTNERAINLYYKNGFKDIKNIDDKLIKMKLII